MAVTMTDRAAEHVKSYLHSEPEAEGMRLAVRTTGCSGYMYVVEAAKSVDEADAVFETNGIKIVIDPMSLQYVDGTNIDFGRDGLNEGFRFENPNVKETCGCGESFSL